MVEDTQIIIPEKKLSRSRSITSLSGLSVVSLNQHLSNLHQIARIGDVKALSIYSQSLEKVNELDPKGNSPLHYACRYTHLKFVEKLLESKEVKIDVEGSDKMTPLHYAARYGRNVTERSVQGTTEVENDDGVSVVKILLDHKAHYKIPLQQMPPHHEGNKK